MDMVRKEGFLEAADVNEGTVSLMESTKPWSPESTIALFIVIGICISVVCVYVVLLLVGKDEDEDQGSRYSKIYEDEDRRLAR